MLSRIAANGLWVLKCALPTFSYAAAQPFFGICYLIYREALGRGIFCC
jgi:hypothetical protein